jgi:hypothetical protein
MSWAVAAFGHLLPATGALDQRRASHGRHRRAERGTVRDGPAVIFSARTICELYCGSLL